MFFVFFIFCDVNFTTLQKETESKKLSNQNDDTITVKDIFGRTLQKLTETFLSLISLSSFGRPFGSSCLFSFLTADELLKGC